MQELDRRKFLGKAGTIAAGLGALYIAATIPGCGSNASDTCPVDEGPEAAPEEVPAPVQTTPAAGLVVVKGTDPAAMLRKGLEAWGGLAALDLAGKKVLIKVNAAFARPPEDATTTNPELLAETISQLLAAGASRVTVFDHILQDLVDQTLEANGIGPAARAAGAELAVYAVRKPGSARVVQIPGATALPSAGILDEIFAADVIVNMPKVKHHSGAGLSMAMKNFIGTTQTMGNFHNVDLHKAIAEINTVIKPALVISDATNILLDHGPGGPGMVADPGQVIIGTDPVAIDSYCCGLFGTAPAQINYLVYGEQLGVGTTDFASLGMTEVSA
ncbi:MAG: DUF362 domain-containing protein [Actinobacteria bacterium]|nr:MAG: DUF362 domain-containing protein [Actinomycetota bacterium]